ncbi:hypothetical protein M407DRAFT_8809 [Tulasnella calospora MUT 4182]|uniref:CID domain-containing protein n=1 Tax=Tulasnella calospora MUT 4182 TaxID=1051891 RepID=A0A0C3KT76_9AGAM|nr:hypothetical protein M407DRAFT_8809 [Tulasnella calospora MUT 4182]
MEQANKALILRLPSNRSIPNSSLRALIFQDGISNNMSKVEVPQEYLNVTKEFEKLLKAAVGGKRLSQSKMTALTELALNNFEHDTQMVSILYRTHKGLATEGKVPSLYVFDSLARAARSRATQSRADPKSSIGNAATFLAKIEGVLDGLIQDMIATGTTEAKEKTLKVLDIWTKANTFPAPVLARLTGYTRDSTHAATDNANNQPSSSTISTAAALAPVTVDPRKAPTPPEQSGSAVLYQAPAPDTSGLLALLAQAQATATPAEANPHNNVPSTPNVGIDSTQLAFLQQLAGNLTQPSGVSGCPKEMNGRANGHSPYTNRSPEPPYSRDYRSDYPRRSYGDRSPPPRDRDYRGDRYDDRDRRGGYGDRTRFDDREGFGDRRGGRSYDRDNERGPSRRDRWDDRGGGPAWRRSRSPQQRDGHREPPHQSSRPPLPERSGQGSPLQSTNPSRQGSVGSFGTPRRDTRFGSPIAPTNDVSHPAAGNTLSPTITTSTIPSFESHPNGPTDASSGGPVSQPVDGQGTLGLQGYDFAKFDPMNPASWDSLGKAWEVSYGKPPTQEELMMFVMTGGMSATGGMPSTGGDATATETNQIPTWDGASNADGQAWSGQQQNLQNQRGRGRGRGRGYGHNRGGYGGGRDGRNGFGDDGYGSSSYSGSSDAVVLGGGDSSSSMSPVAYGGSHTIPASSNATSVPSAAADGAPSSSTLLSGTVATKGQMVKVGDKWKWVKAGDIIP